MSAAPFEKKQAKALAGRLRKTIRGEVRFDAGSRALYATDGSNYRQVPIGVVVPRDSQDIVEAVAACREYDAPVLARGGGTSLAGQCCNVAVVIDTSKYMNRIVELDADRGTARVQPGVDEKREVRAPSPAIEETGLDGPRRGPYTGLQTAPRRCMTEPERETRTAYLLPCQTSQRRTSQRFAWPLEGGLMDETSSCMRCGKEAPTRRLKEVVHEEGRTRVRQMVCSNCLDQIMNESSRVRGVVGTEKAAAAHIDRGPGTGEHKSMGQRG